MRYRANRCRRPVTQLDGDPECWRVFDRAKKTWSASFGGGMKTARQDAETSAKALNAGTMNRDELTWQDDDDWR